MDPFTIAIIVGAATLSGALGHLVGNRRGRRNEQARLNATDLVSENESLKERTADLEQSLDWQQGHNQALQRDLKQVSEQRDQYRKMAESHEVKYQKQPQPESTTQKVWKERRFGGHPRDNLTNLAKELEPFWDKEVEMDIRIVGSDFGGGHGHGQALAEAWKNNNRPIKDIGPFRFHGNGRRAVADFTTFLTDDNTGLMKRTKEGKKVWRDEDSPLSIVVTLTVTETVTPKLPEVHVVEVAIVERTTERVVVEKPVPVEAQPSEETLRQMVEEILARKVAEDEVEKLDRDTVEARVRRLQQKRQGVPSGG